MAPGADVVAPLTPGEVAAAAVRVAEPGFVDGRLVWSSTPPDGSGAAVLFGESPGGPPTLCSPLERSLRSRLYLYGAGAWCSTSSGIVAVDAATQRLGLVSSTSFEPLGDAPDAAERLGDPTPVPGSSWLLVVREPVGGRPVGLDAIDVVGGRRVALLDVDGFLAEPQVAPDGQAVAWLEWPAGSMPWDAATVHVATLDLDADRVSCHGARRVDGGRGSSAGPPVWREDGSLAYVTEAAGWWQPWVLDQGGVVRRLGGRLAEFQRPRWLASRWMAALGDDGRLACAFADRGGEHVGVLSDDGTLEVLDQPCLRVDGLAAHAGRAAWVGATVEGQGAVCAWSSVRGESKVGRASSVVVPSVARTRAPSPERYGFVHDGVDLDGVLWRPTTMTPDTVPPPLVLSVHPGPTGAVDHSQSPVVQLLTSHGFVVASLDYSGSTAHGRAHRERLLGRYGELDVAECAAAARHLAATGACDGRRAFIRGASAGGTTALCALATGVFQGAVAWYPASSFEDTGTGFEAGYLTALVGPDGASRSPIARAAALRGSVLVVQGHDDPIVTPEETATLLAALRATLDDVSFLAVPNEGHGFRTASGRAVALEAELAFYLRLTVAAATAPDRYDASAHGTMPPAAHDAP